MPAQPENTITPRRKIKNYQVNGLINLGYVALSPSQAITVVQTLILTEWSKRRGLTSKEQAVKGVGVGDVICPETVSVGQ